MANGSDALGHTLSLVTVIGFISNCVSIVYRLLKVTNQPKLWKYSLLFQDISSLFLQVGLLLLYVYLRTESIKVCKATGYFLLFGVFECILSFLTTGVILVFVHKPGKPTSVSRLYRNAILIILTPVVSIGAVLAGFPYLYSDIFDVASPFAVSCLPLRQYGEQGAAYAALLVSLWWLILAAVVGCDIILALKLWKFNNQINSDQTNVWQAQLIIQGKFLLKVPCVTTACGRCPCC